jgi:hypothetical protein
VSETVVRDGVTLYAPLLACRPVRLEDVPAERLSAYRAAEAETGEHPPIYPGSVFVPCEACALDVVLGPRQQAVVAMAADVGLAAHVLCMFDAAERASAAEHMTAMHLGNPFRRTEP